MFNPFIAYSCLFIFIIIGIYIIPNLIKWIKIKYKEIEDKQQDI